jgi:hypothetical protein
MRGIERHQRGETIAPVGDIVQDFGVRNLIGIEHRQLGTDGAGVGERQSDLKTVSRGRVIQGINLQRVVFFDDDDARRVTEIFSLRDVLACGLAFDAVDGQARQPQAEDTPLYP